MPFDFKKEYKEYYMPKNRPGIVNVPKANYIAIGLVLDYIKTKPFGESGRVALTCNRGNEIGLKPYRSFGFDLTGNEDEGEVEMAMTVGKKSPFDHMKNLGKEYAD